MRIIYDLGANKGQNLKYYLTKADIVVAVEANPDLCRTISENFKSEIENKRLFVENCVLTDCRHDQPNHVFYLNSQNDLLSSIIKPENDEYYQEILLPSMNIIQVVKKYGEPYYIKMDLEGYDHHILKDLFQNGIFPRYISAEIKSIYVLALMIAYGYNKFRLVNGQQPNDSAGKFGDDIGGVWMPPDTVFKFMAIVGFGWKDLHGEYCENSVFGC